MRLISLGNAVADLVLAIPRFPPRGGDVLAERASLRPGGSGLLALVAAARAGLPGLLCGPTGTGPYGDLVRAELARRGVALLDAPVPGTDTGCSVVLVQPDGERTFVTAQGAEAGAPPLDRARVAADDLVHLPGYALLDPVRAAETLGLLARLPDAAVLLTDPGPLWDAVDAAVRDAVLTRTDWWSANEHEPSGTGRRGVLLRRGAAGCEVRLASGGARLIPTAPVRGDSNGAGDTHAGAFLAALAAGADPFEAAARANAAAASRVGSR